MYNMFVIFDYFIQKMKGSVEFNIPAVTTIFFYLLWVIKSSRLLLLKPETSLRIW
jgi:hypothetical protein